MMVKSTKMTISRPNQSLNDLLTIPRRIKPPNGKLNEYFGLSQSQNSQETADVTLIDTPKKSEEAKLKNDPDGSSHRRVDKSL